MKNNILKKLLGITLLFTFATFGLAFATKNVSAAGTLNKVTMTGHDNESASVDTFVYSSNDELKFIYTGDTIQLHKDGTHDALGVVLVNGGPGNNYHAIGTLEFDKNVILTLNGESIITKKIEIDIDQSMLEGLIKVNGKSYQVYDYGEFYVQMKTPDNSKPIIDGDIHNFVSNYDDPKTVDYFKGFLSATDDTDGDISHKIMIDKDDFTPNKKVLGSHKVIFSVTDNAGNKTIVETYVRVVDIAKPVISGSSAGVEIGYKETWNIENFRKTLTVTDNATTIANSEIKLKTDGYTTNKGKLGTYNVVYSVKDSSGNEGLFTKPVKVIDNVKPLISGPTIITSNNNTIITESEVRAQLSATDEIDGIITNKIKLVRDEFTGNGNKTGKFEIEYSVTDNSGNTANHIVTIDRQDKIPPVIWIQDGVSIITDPTTPLTFEQIIGILRATGQVSTATSTKFNVLYDEYTGNEEKPGTYVYSVQSKSLDGTEAIHNLSIKVADNDDDGIIIDGDFNFKDFYQEYKVWIISVPLVLLALGGLTLYIKKRK